MTAIISDPFESGVSPIRGVCSASKSLDARLNLAFNLKTRKALRWKSALVC